MAPFPTPTRNFYMLMAWATVLAPLMGSSPLCSDAAPFPTAAVGGATASAGAGGAVATCTSSGSGVVTNHSASGGGEATCYAYSSNSSQPPVPPSGVLNPLPSFAPTLVVVPIWVLVSVVIPI